MTRFLTHPTDEFSIRCEIRASEWYRIAAESGPFSLTYYEARRRGERFDNIAHQHEIRARLARVYGEVGE